MPDRPQTPRQFAVYVVERLREGGYEALWAGGCVRDQLLNLTPKDYDIATNATPEQVIDLFGKRRTVPVGVSFGVVMVLGPSKKCGQIEVATFRADGEYLDGRRPDSVEFCSAEEDAKRRDFTINGMFYDPTSDSVIDYVNGQHDLKAKVVRAIGNPRSRFSEDKLRLLRAVRFAATFGFDLEGETADAIVALASKLNQVSVERIAQELRRMLAAASRGQALRDLTQLGLLAQIFPSLAESSFTATFAVADVLSLETFEPTMAALLMGKFDAEGHTMRKRCEHVREECRKLKLSNEETDTICWLVESEHASMNAAELPLHELKPLLADSRAEMLLDLIRAVGAVQPKRLDDYEFLRRFVDRHTREQLDPEPLLDGGDLKEHGVEPGPRFKTLLNQIRDEQLDERLKDRESALKRLSELLVE